MVVDVSYSTLTHRLVGLLSSPTDYTAIHQASKNRVKGQSQKTSGCTRELTIAIEN